MNTKLIAPCGMNCNLCSAYLREENKCPGCRLMINEKGYFKKCTIKHCKHLKENNWKFCSDKCERYPCKRLKDLDKRYKTKYAMSMIKNLENIKKKGIRQFVKDEKKRWTKGNKVFCVHKKEYL